jgi:UDP-N-acetylmuramate--alanine ligase
VVSRRLAVTLPEPPAHIHFVGIGGIGVSGLARMLKDRGYTVSGSDMAASPVTDELRAEGIDARIGHAAANAAGADLVVTTAAAPPANPELQAARAAGIPVVKRAAVLGLLARDFRTLAVAGSHGKSTTSGMAAVALERAGLGPGFAVGAVVPQLGTNARNSRGDYFIVEADEYDYSFLQLDPDVAIVTNIEYDHPDIFPDFQSVLNAFVGFAGRLRQGGTLVVAADDPGCGRLLAALGPDFGARITTFGASYGDWRLAGERSVIGPGERTFELSLAVPGRHNRLNALAVLAASDGLGIEPQALLAGLSEFSGVGRRFEILRDDAGLVVVSDYAHHPTEIAATIAAARERFNDRRLFVIFQPHTYSRTKALLDDFAHALDGADEVVLADIYAARETDDLGVSSASIAGRMSTRVTATGSPADAALVARERMLPGDAVLVLGAGDIYQTAALLSEVPA